MRINQYVATATGCSRRAADAAITAGRVSLNGATAVLGQSAGEDDTVSLDGATICLPAAYTYIMFHKPAGYVTSRTKQGHDPTIYELLPPEYHRLRPAGRLDRDSSGLLLLSDDGAFIQRLIHPSHNKTKSYELVLDRTVTTEHQHRLERGVDLADGPSRLHILTASGPRLTVTLTEGRNRQIRRTMAKLGYQVKRLHRTTVGPYHLGELKTGAWLRIIPEVAP